MFNFAGEIFIKRKYEMKSLMLDRSKGEITSNFAIEVLENRIGRKTHPTLPHSH